MSQTKISTEFDVDVVKTVVDTTLPKAATIRDIRQDIIFLAIHKLSMA